MELQQFCAIWLCLFAIAGSCSRLCEASPTDPEQLSRVVNELRLESSEDLLGKVDAHGRPQGTLKSRVVRYVPYENSNQGPPPLHMIEARITAQRERDRLQRERDRQQREQRQQERTAAVQIKASSSLIQERIDQERGNLELLERQNNAKNKKSKQPSKKNVQH